MSKQTEELLQHLKNIHEQVINAEQIAIKALEKGDKGTYNLNMRNKAEILAEIDSLLPLCPAMDNEFWTRIKKQLKSFSANAKMALNLDSIFYMSALLYPDDHVDGMPDNLLKLIMAIEKDLAS